MQSVKHFFPAEREERARKPVPSQARSAPSHALFNGFPHHIELPADAQNTRRQTGHPHDANHKHA